MKTSSAKCLSPEQIHFYHEQGYIILPDLLSKSQIQELGCIVDDLESQAAGLDRNDDFYDLEPSHRPGAPRVRRLKKPTKQHKAFYDLAREPGILDVIEDLIGHGIRLTHLDGKVNIKAAEYGSPVEWHQDIAGYPHTNDDLLSVSIPLDDCELENGPLLVLPESHKGPLYDHHNDDGVYCSSIDPSRNTIDFEKAVPLTGKAGMVTFHHTRLIHGSALNRSNRPRRLLIYQYAANDAWPLMGVQSLDAFRSTIVRGDMVLVPRMCAVPVRIPLPVAPDYDGLYTSQGHTKNRYFETYEAASKMETAPT